MSGPSCVAGLFLAFLLIAPVNARGEIVAAEIKTSLATASGQIRQFAFDGDAATFFQSKENPGISDHFTLVFERPVSVRTVAVITGKPDAGIANTLDSGVLEFSSDGRVFTKLAQFAEGAARGDLGGREILAIRIKPVSPQNHPLTLREVTIASDSPVETFRFPVEIEVDCSDSPEMKDWAAKAAGLCERWYSRINEVLASDGFRPRHQIKMKITASYDGVAAASGEEIVGSTRYFKEHPDDVGAMIHETTHIVQHYEDAGNPGWLVEGVADYIRFFVFEPGKIGPIELHEARYDSGYRTTAAFLDYLTRKYDKSLVSHLNAVMRAGKYTDQVFKERTGKTVNELDREWKTAPHAPAARQVEHISDWHGEKVNDPFFWLRERSNPEVIKYLEAENVYTEETTREIQPFADLVYKEMLGHIKQTDLTVPVRRGAYAYYARTVEGKQYEIRCRKKLALSGLAAEGPEEVLLDLNELAKGFKFLSLEDFRISDDANLLAYTIDTTGFRQFRLFIKDLRTNVVYPDSAERVTSMGWCSDNRTLFYTTEDAVTKRSNMVWRHELGGRTELVYEEKDRNYTLELERSKDKKMLFLRSASVDTWETRYVKCDQPVGAFEVVLPREKGHKYSVEHRDGLFYLRTNHGAKNFRLVTAPVSNPALSQWKELLPHRSDVLLEGVEIFRDFLVAQEKSAALSAFRLLDFRSGEWHAVDFPETVYAVTATGTPEYASGTFRFQYESMVTPVSVFEYDMAKRKRTLLKRQEVPGYDPAMYGTERAWAVARDGIKIPLSIVYRHGVKKDGTAPLFLYGYGAYGAGMSASFDSEILSLLDRGMVYVIAHIRGGDEMGESWHDDGMLLNKKNTFHDFIDSAVWLCAQGWAGKDRIVIEGGSAGGLLIGAVLVERPDLFKAVHADVAFVDVINTMLDDDIPLTSSEYLEWGNPREKIAFEYMRSYSPYDNLKRQNYPAALFTTSLNDSQVMYWEPTKFVAKMRSQKTDRNALLLKCNMAAGHGGASGRYDRLKETAFEYAWLMSQVGIQPSTAKQSGPR